MSKNIYIGIGSALMILIMWVASPSVINRRNGFIYFVEYVSNQDTSSSGGLIITSYGAKSGELPIASGCLVIRVALHTLREVEALLELEAARGKWHKAVREETFHGSQFRIAFNRSPEAYNARDYYVLSRDGMETTLNSLRALVVRAEGRKEHFILLSEYMRELGFDARKATSVSGP